MWAAFASFLNISFLQKSMVCVNFFLFSVHGTYGPRSWVPLPVRIDLNSQVSIPVRENLVHRGVLNQKMVEQGDHLIPRRKGIAM
jgi:hypothetical protein